jgi:thioredoxin-like negative regulator of GroEL
MGDRVRTEQLVAYGLGLARAGHPRAAAYLLEMANDVRPDPGLTALAASFLLDAGDARGARERLEAGARALGWDSQTKYLRIVAAARGHQLEDAIALARELTDDPDRGADARLLLVDLLLENQDAEGARLAAEAAPREGPHSTDGLLARARVAGREGKREEQLTLLEKVRTVDPDNLSARTAHGIGPPMTS